MSQGFAWNPEDYRDNSSWQLEWATALIEQLHLRGDERILDIGCGDGKVTARLAAQAPQGGVVGVDSSTEMIAYAKSAVSAVNLRLQTGDATALDFEDEFEVVVSFACLHWVRNHRAVLGGIHRALRRGGRILMQFGGKGNCEALLATVNEMAVEETWAALRGVVCPWTFFGADEYRGLLEGAGLKARRVELAPKDMRFEGTTGLGSWVRTTWHPYVQAFRAERVDAFLDELAARYAAVHPPDHDGSLHLPMVRLEVEAEKSGDG
ncbi:MAG: class I SAM-dependent methyltransferase [Bryobacteraceae bacterium]